MVLSHHRFDIELDGLLYPLMVIAAVAIIVFSLVGIASVSGWLPNGLASSQRVELAVTNAAVTPDASSRPVFGCAECGVIESLREHTQ